MLFCKNCGWKEAEWYTDELEYSDEGEEICPSCETASIDHI